MTKFKNSTNKQGKILKEKKNSILILSEHEIKTKEISMLEIIILMWNFDNKSVKLKILVLINGKSYYTRHKNLQNSFVLFQIPHYSTISYKTWKSWKQ